ncbi:MAG: hypothetical protein WD904_06670 [Dehalococcoidia bacterium]
MRVRTGRRDWLWGVVVGLLVLVVVASLFFALRPSGIKTYATIADVKCQSGERLEYHVHSYLAILIEGEQIASPENVGIRPDECLFWLHTHGRNGVIHVEAPEAQDFTLGQFFQIWGQPLSGTQLLDRTADATHSVRATVNGETFAGDPASIVLRDLETMVLQYGPPFGEATGSPFEE